MPLKSTYRSSDVVAAVVTRVLVVVARGSIVVTLQALLLQRIVIPLPASRVEPKLELNFNTPVLDTEQPFTLVALAMVSEAVSVIPTERAAASHSEADFMEQKLSVSSHCPATVKLKSQ